MLLRSTFVSLVLITVFAAGRITAPVPPHHSDGRPDGASEASLGDVRRELERVRASVEALHATAFAGGLQTAPMQAYEAPRPLARKAAAEKEPEQSPEEGLAAERVIRRVEDTIATGRWSREDAEVLRSSLGALSSGQRDELLAKLADAVNRGEVVPEGLLF